LFQAITNEDKVTVLANETYNLTLDVLFTYISSNVYVFFQGAIVALVIVALYVFHPISNLSDFTSSASASAITSSFNTNFSK
jgi:hypothetical protein